MLVLLYPFPIVELTNEHKRSGSDSLIRSFIHSSTFVLQVKSPKIKASAGLCSFWKLWGGQSVSLLFPASEDCSRACVGPLLQTYAAASSNPSPPTLPTPPLSHSHRPLVLVYCHTFSSASKPPASLLEGPCWLHWVLLKHPGWHPTWASLI